MIEALSDGGILTAICGLILAAGLTGFGLGWSGRGEHERRRQARINAALDGKLREVGSVTGPALYARTRGEPFTQVLRRHAGEAQRRERV